MSVYTRLTSDDIDRLLSDYAIGELEHFEGISEGITNTNYFVDTTLGRWVLTLFEALEPAELPFYLNLMDHLAGLGVPGAHPVARRDGGFLSHLAGRPAALVYRLRGRSLVSPDPAHCAALGATVAELHRAGESFPDRQSNSRGLGWIEATRSALAGHLGTRDKALLDDEIAFQQAFDYAPLPCGVIHADLFRDNVLFEDRHVSGLIDFYYACYDHWLFDLAVICNDWCHRPDGKHLPEHWRAIVDAYRRRRPFTAAENDAWPAMLRAAALRFWVSRLADWHFPQSGHDTHQKDPQPFAELLIAHRDAPPRLLN